MRHWSAGAVRNNRRHADKLCVDPHDIAFVYLFYAVS